jgi:hypothetical protein
MDTVLECDHFMFVGISYKCIQSDQHILGNSSITKPTENISRVVSANQDSIHCNYIWKICVMIKRLSIFDDWLYNNT